MCIMNLFCETTRNHHTRPDGQCRHSNTNKVVDEVDDGDINEDGGGDDDEDHDDDNDAAIDDGHDDV